MHFEFDNGTRARRSLGAIAALLLALAATPALSDAPAAAAPQRVRVEDAWIRSLPAGLPAGGYIRLSNVGDTAVNLVAASSPAYAEVSIHRSVESGGTNRTRASISPQLGIISC
jgi:copper(I)-binding protein